MSAKGEGSPSTWRVNSSSKTRETKKKTAVVNMEASEVCSLVTLISFYTTRTFNHETTCTQLRSSPVGTLLAPCSLSTTCCGAGLSPGCCGVRRLQNAMAATASGPPKFLQDERCGFGLAKASWDLSRGHQPLPVIPSALPLSYFPRPKCHGG